MWGNGLLERDKTSSIVAQEIEKSTGRKVIRTVYAMSGATLSRTPIDQECTFRCSGEVPTAYRLGQSPNRHVPISRTIRSDPDERMHQ